MYSWLNFTLDITSFQYMYCILCIFVWCYSNIQMFCFYFILFLDGVEDAGDAFYEGILVWKWKDFPRLNEWAECLFAPYVEKGHKSVKQPRK